MTTNNSKTTQAIIFRQTGGPEVMQLEEIAVPSPQAGEVTIRQHAVGVNFIDVYTRSGSYPPSLPSGLGFEAAGVIEAMGPGVKDFKIGDRVAYGQSPLGAYAGMRTMSASQLVKLPKGVSFEEGAALMLKGLTVQYLFRQTYRLQGNETILLHAAAGGVGLIACQWAKALGVKVIGTVGSDEKAALAKANGAWATINYSKENIVERVLELTKGAKVPVVYDGVGKDTWDASLDCLQPRGLMVSYGSASGPITGLNLNVLAQKGSLFVTRTSMAAHVGTPEKMKAAADELFGLVVKKKIRVRVENRYALKDAAQAHRDLEARKTTGSCILLPG